VTVSVIVPVYNEAGTVIELLDRVAAAPFPSAVSRVEVVVVDDGSTDGTRELLQSYRIPARADEVRLSLLVELQPANGGKGAALRAGFAAATCEILLVQDADLEYDPADYPVLLGPILDGRADVVFGSRFQAGAHRVLFFWHYVGNRLLTMLSNMMTDLNLTDMETCYKAFRRDVYSRIRLTSSRFGFEPEFTARVARLKCRIYEVPISYHGRTYADGKKISWKDGVEAIWCILRFNIWDR
jgi:glycosyltransferase involved in cell wall biosynthesis